MIRIRPEHLTAFQPNAEAVFVERLIEHLRDEHEPLVRGFPDDILEEMVRNGVAKGRLHGITRESSLTAFVALMFEISPNFDEHPPIRRVLRDTRIPPDARIDALVERVSPEEWEEAERRYDASAWFPRSPDEA